jgi:hypothetical protein
MMGVADLPVETLKVLGIHPSADKAKKSKDKTGKESTSPTPMRQESAESDSKLAPDDSSMISSVLTQTTTASDSTALEPPSHLSTTSRASSLSERPLSPQMRDAVGPLSDTAAGDSDSARPRTPRSRSRNSAADVAAKAASAASTSPARDGQRRSASATLAAYNPVDPLDTIYGTGRGLGKIVGAGLKSPLDFTLALSRGFHNLPRLYGEEPRTVGRVTGFHSGLRTAGKEFGQGIFEGVAGLVTQPVEGARREGAAGFLKGMGRGVAGLVVKPAAAGYALPAYALMGVYKEMQKRLGGESVGAYIVAARVAQGYGELLEVGEGGREGVEEAAVHRWSECLAEVKTSRMGAKGAGAVRAFVDRRAEQRRGSGAPATQPPASESASATTAPTGAPQPPPPQREAEAEARDAELEEALRLSLQLHEEERAATGLAEKGRDAEVWRAIKASLDEMHAADQAREGARLREAVAGAGVDVKEPVAVVAAVDEDDDDEGLRKAMRESLADEEDRRKKAQEEDIVMEYVRRQSEAEEQWRRKREAAAE